MVGAPNIEVPPTKSYSSSDREARRYDVQLLSLFISEAYRLFHNRALLSPACIRINQFHKSFLSFSVPVFFSVGVENETRCMTDIT